MHSLFHAAPATALALLLSGPACAGAAQPAADGAAAAPVVKPKDDPRDPNRMICKTEIPTGSRLGGTRVCMTRAQWEANARENEMEIDQATMSKGGTSVGK